MSFLTTWLGAGERSAGRDVDDPVLGGRSLPYGAAGQLGIGTAYGQYLHLHRLLLRFDHKIDEGLRPVPVVRSDVFGGPHGDI